jgi:hypothetical protein
MPAKSKSNAGRIEAVKTRVNRRSRTAGKKLAATRKSSSVAKNAVKTPRAKAAMNATTKRALEALALKRLSTTESWPLALSDSVSCEP